MPENGVPDWRDIDYLAIGTPTQREVHSLLKRSRLLDRLREYDPVLAGTVPIDLQVEGSDLDIVCEVYDVDRFERRIQALFGREKEFVSARRFANGIERLKSNFMLEAWPVEIFGQPIPAMRQNAVVHMTVEFRLLSLLGSGF